MIFGNPAEFAVEALVEPGPQFGPVQGRNVVGRLRVWIGGDAIGRIEEPACWLGPPCAHLLEMRDGLHSLWEQAFDGLSPDDIFDRLDYLCFCARRGQSLSEEWSDDFAEKARGHQRFVFLLHSSEAFDGWKAFLVRPTPDSLQALVAGGSQQVVLATTFRAMAFTDAVSGFAAWLAEQERLLVRSE